MFWWIFEYSKYVISQQEEHQHFFIIAFSMAFSGKWHWSIAGVILRSECGGTWWRTGGEVKGKLANGVGSQYSHTASGRSVSSITNADARTSAASSRLNRLPRLFKWTRPFRRKTKSGFCACAIRFRTSSNTSAMAGVEDSGRDRLQKENRSQEVVFHAVIFTVPPHCVRNCRQGSNGWRTVGGRPMVTVPVLPNYAARMWELIQKIQVFWVVTPCLTLP